MTRLAFASLLLGATIILAATRSDAQTPTQTQTPPPAAAAAQAGGGGAELYHVHFVKAAPGKLLEMIEAYLAAPQAPGDPAPPVILRHREGDDWNLLVLQPLGAEATLRAAGPPGDVQAFITKSRPLRGAHTDTFAIGPAWSEARKLVLGNEAAQPAGGGAGGGGVYVVSVFRSLPGHRDQLEGVLKKIAAEEPSSTLTLQHLEGASWEFLMISRYDSWTAFGESEEKASGKAIVNPASTALTEHLAEHHDTVAVRVTRQSSPNKP